MKRNLISASVLSLLSLACVAPSAFAWQYYGKNLQGVEYRGTYNSLPAIHFYVSEEYRIVEIPSNVNLKVNNSPGTAIISDFAIPGDQRQITVPLADVEMGQSVSISMIPGAIKVCGAKESDEDAILLKDIPTGTISHSNPVTLSYSIQEIDQYQQKMALDRSTNQVQFIGGDYTMTLYAYQDNLAWRDYTKYTPDSENDSQEGFLLRKKSDDSFEKCYTCPYKFNDLDFTLHIPEIIRTPGEYYLQYPIGGVINYQYANNGIISTGGYHIANVLAGPFIISDEQMPDDKYATARMSWVTPASIYSDAVPEVFTLCAVNATNLFSIEGGRKCLVNIVNSATNSSRDFEVDPEVSDNNLILRTDNSWMSDPGKYVVKVTINGAVHGINQHDFLLSIPENQSYTRTFTIIDPVQPENLDLYVKRESSEAYELKKDESVVIRLVHPDQARGLKIFTRWTPSTFENHAHIVAEKENDGFSEHTGNIEISGPGVLEYYTRLSNTDSDIKAIHVSVKNDSDVNTGIQEIRETDDDGSFEWYDLKGNRILNPGSGVFIRRNSDGRAIKVLR